MMTPTEKLADLSLELPPAPKAVGVYRPIVIIGDTAYLSGHLPIRNDGTMLTGVVGKDLSVEEGYEAARLCALNLLATLQDTLGSLERVKRVVKTVGFVNSVDPGFTSQPQVINGCSELLAEVFGHDIGIGARSAVGACGLPAGVAAEVELIVEIAGDA